MRVCDLARLLALAIIWSASFAFIRVLVPAIGPWWVAAGRVLIGGVTLIVMLGVAGIDARVRRDWRHYAVIGVLNCAVPFMLYGYAALHLPASYLVILNAATPLFTAIAAAVWLGERVTSRLVAGIVLAVAGVVVVSRAGPVELDTKAVLGIAASLGATICYALAGVWMKRRGQGLSPLGVSAWGQFFAGVGLLPFAAASEVHGPIDAGVVVNLLALGVVCSALAYVLYFRLIADVGPTRAVSVTFLMPAFGMLWGALFLRETITLAMIAGAVAIVAGTTAMLRKPAIVSPATPDLARSM